MKLLLFDIDLTLIDTAGSGRRSMTLAFEQLFGFQNGMAEVSFAGRTDRVIFRDAMSHNGLEWQEEKQERFKNLYLELLATEIKKPDPGKHIEPGVGDLLNELRKQKDLALGLLTGNWQEGAKIKLEHFGLYHFFELGAFADDAENRNDLPKFAVARSLEKHRAELTTADVFIIGDTPLDVACAKSYGAKSVAVATGLFSHDELANAGPDFLFRDFSNVESFFEVLER